MTEPSHPFAVARYLRAVAGANPDGPTDAELLARFAANRDQGAFELLVWRHAGMVTTVCRNILRDHHAAEDATQAAFLALARKAASVRENPAGWLFRVASRIALRSRKSETPLPRTVAEIQAADHEDNSILHEELAKLPEKYRVPILLCYFEGLSHADAAKRLGWPVGTVAGRIARAKDILQSLLVRRGVVIPSAGLTALCITNGIDGAFASETARAALAFASGHGAIDVAPSIVHAAKGAIRAMVISKLKTTAGVLFACAALTAGGMWAMGQGPDESGQAAGSGLAQPASTGSPVSSPDWWLIAINANGGLAVHPTDAKTVPLPAAKPKKEYSPDGKKRLLIDFKKEIPNRGGQSTFDQLLVEDLTKDLNAFDRFKGLAGYDTPERGTSPQDPVWSPDGKRIAYVATHPTEQMRQVHVVNTDGTYLVRLRPAGAGGIAKPLFLPDGSIAYFVQTERKGKQTFYDLMIHDGTKAKRLIERIEAWDTAIRPDGKQIAIGTDSLSIYDAKSGKLISQVPMSDVNKDWPVVFTNLVWRPDGKAIGFKPTFVGGISVGPGQKPEDIRMPGDAHIGVIDFSGEKPTAKTFEVGRGYLPDYWRDGMAVQERGLGGAAAAGASDARQGTAVDRIKIDAKAPTPGTFAKRESNYQQRLETREKLKQLMIAIRNFEAAYGHLPHDIVDEKGKPLLSWRVQLLPYLEQANLFNQFKLNEPWDSEHNRKLLMGVEVYRSNFQPKGTTETYFQAFTGPGVAFNEPGKKLKFADITDGTVSTIAVAEVGPAVPWTKPADVPYHPGQAFARVEWPFANAIQLATPYGDTWAVKPDIGELILRRMIERNDGDVVPDLKTIRPSFPAEAAEEKAMLARTLDANAALLAETDEVLKEYMALKKLRNSLTNDVEKARDMTQELKRFLDTFKPRVKKERDELGLRPGAKVPEPKELPKP